jgi:hypothetical protein
MRCPVCHSENPETSKFCIECGAAFKRHYPDVDSATFRKRSSAEIVVSRSPPKEGDAHLRQILESYASYYNKVRTHL